MSESATPATSVIFDATAEGYAATMAPSLRPVAAEVVRRAHLQPGERVLDVGCGTGIAAAAAHATGAAVVGLDGAPGMIAIARREVPGVGLPGRRLQYAALRRRRASTPSSARTRCSSPTTRWPRCVSGGASCAPAAACPSRCPGRRSSRRLAIYAEVYHRHGVTAHASPTRAATAPAGWARDAGWTDAAVDQDPSVAIRLPDAEAFATWRRTGARGAATAGWSEEQHAALTADMLAVTPRGQDGGYVIPFGAIYLTARN